MYLARLSRPRGGHFPEGGTHGRKTGCRVDNCPGPCARTLNGDMRRDMQRMIKKALSEGTIFVPRDNRESGRCKV